MANLIATAEATNGIVLVLLILLLVLPEISQQEILFLANYMPCALEMVPAIRKMVDQQIFNCS